MASIGLETATPIQGGSIALDPTDAAAAAASQGVYHVPPPSQVPDAPSEATQQDTVTVSGTAPTSGNIANSNRPATCVRRQGQFVQPTRPIAQYFGLNAPQVFRELLILSHRP